MSDICSNTLKVTGDTREVVKFIQAFKGYPAKWEIHEVASFVLFLKEHRHEIEASYPDLDNIMQYMISNPLDYEMLQVMSFELNDIWRVMACVRDRIKIGARYPDIIGDGFHFNAIVPVPLEILKRGYDRAGGGDGYEWCKKNWGTKWDLGADVSFEHEDGTAKWHFSTANTPPKAFVVRASEKFPELSFNLYYEQDAEMTGGICTVKRGIAIDNVYSGTDEENPERSYHRFLVDVRGYTEEEYKEIYES